MELKDLYAQYGQFSIELEILQAKINNCRKAIVEEITKPIVSKKEE